ncbi:MAG TPA: hypothetical protein VJT75_18145 [Thermoleophilaceae bacterium]|nr:hypothetical protein [Thermoleophilaceae bacterium]
MGLGTAKQVKNAKARTRVSLHGLKSNTTYSVVGASQPCSASADGQQVYEQELIAPVHNDDRFVTATVQRNGSLSNVKSVRVYELGDDGSRTGQACGRVYTVGPNQVVNFGDWDA